MWPLRTIPGAALSADGGVDCAAKKHNGLNIGLQAGLDGSRGRAGIAISAPNPSRPMYRFVRFS